MPAPPHSQDVKHILDGGSLLHRLPWPRESSYRELTEMYVAFVSRKYTDATIIFDGYCSGPGTKDMTHLCRNKGMVGRNVAFTADIILCEKKEVFLSNSDNKQQFLHLLSGDFEAKCIRTCHAEGDADCLIIQEALQAAKLSPTNVIGEQSDLFILLLHHIKNSLCDVLFTSGALKKQRVKPWDSKGTQARLGSDVCSNFFFFLPMPSVGVTPHPDPSTSQSLCLSRS